MRRMKKLGKRRKVATSIAQNEKERSRQVKFGCCIWVVRQQIVQQTCRLINNSAIIAKKALAQDGEWSRPGTVVDFHATMAIR